MNGQKASVEVLTFLSEVKKANTLILFFTWIFTWLFNIAGLHLKAKSVEKMRCYTSSHPMVCYRT